MQHFLELSALRRAVAEGDTIGLLRPDEAVFSSMLGSWAQQQLSRGLAHETVEGRSHTIQRFRDFTSTHPWAWTASDVEEYTTHLREKQRTRASIRQVHSAIRVFCHYLIAPEYDWVELCVALFGSAPSQVCFEWNTTRHVSDYEGKPARRAFTYEELQALFDLADSKVNDIAESGKKGALAALRDAQMFKTAYAFGLRRAELRGLDLADMHRNARVPTWGPYAALYVRFAKSSGGGGPRRRTVLLVPEYSWWVDTMRQWVEEGRPRFAPGDLHALWPTERQTRVSLEYIDRRFTAIRREANLDPNLSLHCLRHSYVTHLIEYGYAERFVQEQVGHLHSSTTAIYTSVSGDFKNRLLADALDRFNQKELGDAPR
jgi:site-specific recombinase XerD